MNKMSEKPAKKKVDVTIEICGSAGDGSIAAGQMLNLAMTFIGYHVMNFDSYPAEIRGFGKSVAHTRVSGSRLHMTGSKVDCLVALDDPHSITSLDTLAENGVIIYDSKPMDYLEEDQAIAGFVEPGMVGYGVPLRELSTRATRSARSRNIVALGALAGIFMIPAEAFHHAIKRRFLGKKESLVQANIEAFDLGFRFGGEEIVKADHIDFGFRGNGRRGNVEITSGNAAVARAFIDAGLRLYAGYPITPATRILEIMARQLPAKGGVVVQTEDEISAIGHVIGSGFAGHRAATATAGPGFSLMVEFMNLAVMSEVPLVVIDSQRGGPSTGLPTKTEQADLNIAIFGGSGDSPRPVIAPTRVEECYELVLKAFEVAEAFQTPVVVLLDFFLSNRMEDVEWEKSNPARFGVYKPKKARRKSGEPYRRYAFTESGISPRSLPGMEGLFYTATGLEHDETGLPNYSPRVHQDMTRKRHAKLETLGRQWPAPETVGPAGKLEVGIVSWGSTVGSAMEAIEDLTGRGVRAGGVFPRLMWPVNEEALRAFSARSGRLVVVEMNHTGQYASIVERVVRREVFRLCRVHGAPLPSSEIVSSVLGSLENPDEKGKGVKSDSKRPLIRGAKRNLSGYKKGPR